MRIWIRCALFVTVFFAAIGQERFRTGAKGLHEVADGTHHRTVGEEPHPAEGGGLRWLEGTRPAAPRSMIEIRGPDETELKVATSNRQGRFRFGRMSDGAYTIKLTMKGFRSVFGTIAVQRSLKSSQAGEPFRIYMLPGV